MTKNNYIMQNVVELQMLAVIILCCIQYNTTNAQDQQPKYTGCDIDEYYSSFDKSDISNWQRQDIQSLLSNTHQNILPYTSSSSSNDDVWKALIDLDAGNVSDTVHLIYKDIDVAAVPYGTSDTWNREHLWPKSLGVGYTGPDFTDVHHLRPADWNVNAARGNLHFGNCQLDTDTTEDIDCRVPATTEAADDTASNGFIFLPPINNRGDIARALFYMDIRYSGTGDNNVLDLTLTDFPTDSSSSSSSSSSSNDNEPNTNEIGYLSQLLEWHINDPVSNNEIERNNKVCTKYQGNRNIFVDYPNLVEIIFGQPKQLLRFENGLPIYDPNTNAQYPPNDNNDNNSSNSNSNSNDDNTSTSNKPTKSPIVSNPTNGTDDDTNNDTDTNDNNNNDSTSNSKNDDYRTCDELDSGDILLIKVQSMDPDTVGLVSLVNINKNVQLYMTDNAWTGSTFRTSEGIITLPLNDNMNAGTVFGYRSSSSTYGDSNSKNKLLYSTDWIKESGSFSLSESGDSVIVYCIQQQDNKYKFLSASTSNTWLDSNLSTDTYGSATSAVPSELMSVGSIEKISSTGATSSNYQYIGPTNDSKEKIQQYWSDTTNWGDNYIDEDLLKTFPMRNDDGTSTKMSSSAASTSVAIPTTTTFIILLFCSYAIVILL